MTDHRPITDRRRESRGGASSDGAPPIEPRVGSLLACPLDRGAVWVTGSELVCERCGRR